jgi:hypothetical protein
MTSTSFGVVSIGLRKLSCDSNALYPFSSRRCDSYASGCSFRKMNHFGRSVNTVAENAAEYNGSSAGELRLGNIAQICDALTTSIGPDLAPLCFGPSLDYAITGLAASGER